jgi:TIR domain/inactive STAND
VRDFFISFNKADRPWAEWIAWALEEKGYSVWYQHWDFGIGQNFVLLMQQALEESKQLVAVLSENYFTGNFTAPEWSAAFAKDPKGEQRKLVPIRVERFEAPGLFSSLAYADIFDLEELDATTVLLHAVRPPVRPVQKPMFPGAAASTAIERVAPDTKPFPGPPTGNDDQREPETGHIVPYSCNRFVQQEVFERTFLDTVRCSRRNPQLYVIHGRAREGHESLVKRLSETLIQEFVDVVVKPRGSVGTWQLKWRYKDDVETATKHLLEDLIAQAHTNDKEFRFKSYNYSVDMFREAIKPAPHQVIIVQYEIEAHQWTLNTERTINAYLELWDELIQDTDIPHFVIFLNVVYPMLAEGNGWKIWDQYNNWWKRRRVVSQLNRIKRSRAKKPDGHVEGYFCRYTVLDELPCVKLEHVQRWFEDHKLGRNKVAWETQSRNIYRKMGWRLNACKNMADIEAALTDFIETMQSSTGNMRTN